MSQYAIESLSQHLELEIETTRAEAQAAIAQQQRMLAMQHRISSIQRGIAQVRAELAATPKLTSQEAEAAVAAATAAAARALPADISGHAITATTAQQAEVATACTELRQHGRELAEDVERRTLHALDSLERATALRLAQFEQRASDGLTSPVSPLASPSRSVALSTAPSSAWASAHGLPALHYTSTLQEISQVQEELAGVAQGIAELKSRMAQTQQIRQPELAQPAGLSALHDSNTSTADLLQYAADVYNGAIRAVAHAERAIA